jgi:hypothetical protein
VGNTLLTIDMITKEALRLAHEKATFIGTINRQFDDSFGASSGKIGDTLRIRYPSEYTRRQGSRVMDVQDSVQTSTALVVATQDGVDMRFNSRELALDLDEFSQIHLQPAMATLVSNIDADVLVGCTKLTPNWATNASPLLQTNVTTMSAVSSLTAAGNARTRLNQTLAPKGDRRIQVDSGTMAQIVSGTASYFNPSGAVSEQFREGLVARTAMADYYENERVFNMATVSSALVTSWRITSFISTLGVNSAGVSTTQALPVGQVFTLGNATGAVLDVHPETKQAFPNAKQFTVVSTVFGATSTITFSPPIFWSGPRQNVGGVFTATSLALSSLTINSAGTTSATFPTGLMYHRDAFTFATAELPLMSAAEKCVRKTFDGISLRVWQDADIRNDELLTRIDILYGFAAIRPQWACRILGTGT